MVTATDSKRAATMSEWPEGWFRGDEGQAGGPAEPGAADQTVSIQAGAADVTNPAGQYQVRDYGGTTSPGAGAAPPGAWPTQPPTRSAPGSAPPRRRIPGSRGWRSWSRPRQVGTVLASLVVVVVLALVAGYFYLNSQINRQNVLVDYPGRPVPGVGTNWLITGSDSRQGLTRKQELALSVGRDLGPGESDTIMILHIPAGGGRPLLISVPRDSYVNIPGHGYNKINAAFAFGGPALLAKTVQDVTGLYINHYMGIGFGGFVNVVNAVGGVRMCLVAPLHEVSSGVNLKRGCQTLNGTQALAYVRDRHSFATEDLQREQDQRLFLHALLTKMTSLGVVLNPFAAWPAASGSVKTLTVDQGTSLWTLYGVARAMRDPLTTTVPVANANYITSNAGDALLWNTAQARELFSALQSGKPVPKSLITGSSQAS
jgi:LCP family protein required for cell wall assembly